MRPFSLSQLPHREKHEASGHDFSRADKSKNEMGFSPCRTSTHVILPNSPRNARPSFSRLPHREKHEASGHDFDGADKVPKNEVGFSPCGSSIHVIRPKGRSMRPFSCVRPKAPAFWGRLRLASTFRKPQKIRPNYFLSELQIITRVWRTINARTARAGRGSGTRDRLERGPPPGENKYFCGNLQIITGLCDTRIPGFAMSRF